MTAAYDQVIADYFRSETTVGEFPPHITVRLERKSQLRYGENPHQKAAVYRIPRNRSASVLNARHIHGRELSYNNLLDLDSALAIARSFGQPAAAVIKHNNPCGAATCAKLSLATRKALDGDPVSAFGSVLGFNRTVDLETAEILVEPNRFIEAIVAPDFEAGAVGVLTTRPKWRDNVRLMQVGQLPNVDPETVDPVSIRRRTRTRGRHTASHGHAVAYGDGCAGGRCAVGRHLLCLGNGASRQEQRDCAGARYVAGWRRGGANEPRR